MKEHTIDCTGIDSPRELHSAIAREMAFPEGYGHNLDALHDCLNAIREDTRLSLIHFSQLDTFAYRFRRVFSDCEQENPHLIITLL